MIHERIIEVETKEFSFGKYKIFKDIYYLHHSHIGVRIEVSTFTRTKTVEVRLVGGDGKLVKQKVWNKTVFSDPSPLELNNGILEMVNYAQDNKII